MVECFVFLRPLGLRLETHLPFGGIKQTGNGHREAGTAGLDVFSEWKSIYVDYSGKIQKAQIDVPDQPVVKRAKR